MIDPAYVQRMARYNRWQNENLYGVADRLSDDERRRERGAFFGSIHKTLSHLMWADTIWMSRFTPDVPKPAAGIPESVSLFPDWDGLKRERAKFDATILDWADVGAGLAFLQSSDPSSRPGALPADASRRSAARH
jgi:uncharacterized damage-inducible protein DinB